MSPTFILPLPVLLTATRYKAGDELIRGETIIIHTGAAARSPGVSGIESVPWLDNKGILDLSELPDHLLVIGGLEFGQAFRRFGSRVTVLERGNRIIFREDPGISSLAQELLEDEGLVFHLGTEILFVEKDGAEITVMYRQGTDKKKIEGSHLLVAAGRAPAVDNLNLEAAGVQTNERGYIEVDDGRTSKKHIYALGDVNGKGAFTHTSVHDGQVFLDHYLYGGERRISDRNLIYAMYIDPPLARVGINAAEAARRGIDFLAAEMPMSAVSRAREKAETGGVMKVITDARSKTILGTR
ncbi:FAD-dependent oxidoreductase [Marispirochaeta sp.]|uniref:FAD-dependent oxidoreductase n=1 Tax=Marispirochaeta sp. TaxID=2038653 RepID=UPI0029C6A651|nr:FAD-dependent oxidoreductase [Marispirochaeta sp.]